MVCVCSSLCEVEAEAVSDFMVMVSVSVSWLLGRMRNDMVFEPELD